MGSPQGKRPRIVLADDYPRLLVALRRVLEPSCEVVGSVSSGREAVDAVMTLKPDVVVLDLTLPDLNGLEVCRQIKRIVPETHVVLLTAADDKVLQESAIEAGASGFVAKHSVGDLTRIIQRIFAVPS
jgi:DNA-binding NarL/FixJ family response regulator